MGVCRSAAYARQLTQKQQMGHLEAEHVKPSRGMQLSSDDSGMMSKGVAGVDVLKSKKDQHDLSNLIKSIKMKSKQVQLPSDDKKRKDGKAQVKGMEKKRR